MRFCKRGHECPDVGKCLICNKANRTKWNRANKDRIQKYHQKYLLDSEHRQSAVDRANQFKQKRRQEMKRLKEGLRCARCPESFWACLDFHHRDSSIKSFSISEGGGRYGLNRLLAEIEKCEVLCANCHRKEHIQ